MVRSIPYTLLVLALPLLSSCEAMLGKEVARMHVAAPGPDGLGAGSETELDLKKGDDIGIWTEMDVEYDGRTDLLYQFQIVLDTVVKTEVMIDPFDKSVTMGEVKTEIRGHTTWRFTGKIADFDILEDGSYLFRARSVAQKHPVTILRKSDLMIRK